MDGRPTEVTVGQHRISVTVFGSGEPAVIVEPGFGGSAQSWRAIAEAVGQETTVVTYDRAAYGTSSRAMDHRTPREIARDLHGVLDAAGIARPVVLVGHSNGGVYVRAFAGLWVGEVAGMVLVDSAHETQEQVLRGSLPWRVSLLEAMTLPLVMAVPRKVRGGADRRSIMREFRSVKLLTAVDQPLAGGALGDRPLIVLTRGPGSSPAVPEEWRLWHSLHEDLARLSANSHHVVSGQPGHYIHKREPDLVTTAIRDVLRSARTQTPLAELTRPGPPPPERRV
jgi:pimeloyl-ACP methyl ester carboxylesterase